MGEELRETKLEKNGVVLEILEIDDSTCEVTFRGGELDGSWYETEDCGFDDSVSWFRKSGYKTVEGGKNG